MSDVATWKLRGPVRTLRREIAEWDAAREEWKPPRQLTIVTFRSDGKTSESEFHNPDGSILRTTCRYDDRGRLLEMHSGPADGPVTKTIHSYDDAGRHVRTVVIEPDGAPREYEKYHYDSSGRKTKVTFLHTPPGLPAGVQMHHSIEGTEQAFSAPGATTMTTTYGEGDKPEEVLLHDAKHAVVRRVTFTRDREGRTLREDVQFGGQFPFPELASEARGPSQEEAAALAALMASVFANQTLHSTTYAYDRHGRVLERSTRMGVLSESRTTYHYDDRDNPIEEVTEDQSREIGADSPDEAPRARSETARRHQVRYEYQYDREGNWTERIVSSRQQDSSSFQRSNVERRQITYHPR